MKPAIRWAGSKYKTLQILRPFWELGHRRYIEPFAGSACLFFDIEPEAAILGDLNSELIRAYRYLRDDTARVMDELRSLSITKENYYRMRSLEPSSLPGYQAAARFFFLNKLCFNGLYRTNSAGKFNVPFGQSKGAVSFNFEQLNSAARLLARSKLRCSDFESTIDYVRVGDFVYLDPPYVSTSRRTFSEYLPNSFSPLDLDRLERTLSYIDKCGATFVISYAEDTDLSTYLSNWNTQRVQVRRNIAGFAGHRRHSYEIIASNREVSAR